MVFLGWEFIGIASTTVLFVWIIGSILIGLFKGYCRYQVKNNPEKYKK